MAHIYFGVTRKDPATGNTTPMTDNQWAALLNLIETGCPSQDTVNSQNRFQTRYDLNNTGAIYEALFNDTDITLEKFRQRLVTMAGVADNRITVTTSTRRFATRTSLIGTFRLDGVAYFFATIFGRASDGQAVTWPQSTIECIAYLAVFTADWDGP